MIVTALAQQRPDGSLDASEPGRRHLVADASTYEAARADVLGQLPEGWIVAS